MKTYITDHLIYNYTSLKNQQDIVMNPILW